MSTAVEWESTLTKAAAQKLVKALWPTESSGAKKDACQKLADHKCKVTEEISEWAKEPTDLKEKATMLEALRSNIAQCAGSNGERSKFVRGRQQPFREFSFSNPGE